MTWMSVCFITSPDPHRGNDRFDRSYCGTIVVGTFSLWHCPAVTWRIWLYTLMPFYKDVSRKSDLCCALCVFFCLFYVMQKQRCLSLFLLSASPPGPSTLSQLFFLVQQITPDQPNHIHPPLFSLPPMVLSLGFSTLWWRAAGESEELL